MLEFLCCPVSRRPLERAGRELLGKANAAASAGELLFVDGEPVSGELSDALVTDDQRVLYAIDDGIPVLLPERGIGTEQLK